MKKVIVFLAPGFEETEAVTPVDYLRRAGVEVVTAALSAHGESADKRIFGSHKVEISADVLFPDWLAKNGEVLPDAVFIPGGMPGAANVGLDAGACDFIRRMFMKEKLVAAICAAPVVVLAKLGVLSGKRFTCYPGMETQLSEYCGSSYPEITAGSVLVKNVPFVRDGNVLTGRGPGTAGYFAVEMVSALCGSDKAKEIERAVLL
ncbi:DJ-1 family glyoxalase III [Treponema parvum]|uniref:DJ-1 family glyoxalase III n=1 Tax=Treponema parvum TaxID=138851 RepID=UPI001AEBDF1B|nr:DJ-1 family glyoxalase III [Treponema parvum]QTQ16987.1 DJ-1/PfpI family protein [Treponema parvum]